MGRRRKVDPGVTIAVDRHGKERARFRLKGMDCYLPHPATPEYAEAYKLATQGIVPRKMRLVPKSIGELFQRFYASARFNKGGEAWRRTVRVTLEEFRNEAKDVPVADFTDYHIETILVRRLEKRTVDGRNFGGPAAATRLHEQLVRLFDFAQNKLRWIDRNPAREADSPVNHKTDGYHSWTDGEIAQFQARHPLGSRARLALELALWMGIRRADIAKLRWDQVTGGRGALKAGKTGKGVNLRIAPDLQAALDALPIGEGPLLVTSQGKGFTAAGLGNWFRDRCNEAGLPQCSMHGLRKALARRAADMGATQAQLKAVGQWSNDEEVAVYIAAANQQRLADEAIDRVVKGRTLPNRGRKVGHKSQNLPHKKVDMAGAGV